MKLHEIRNGIKVCFDDVASLGLCRTVAKSVLIVAQYSFV